MNEEELKNLWQSEQTAPTVDFAELQKSLNIWHDKLRRKVKIEIWVQSAAVALTFIPVFFYPKFIFFALFILVLGIWYIPELRKLYKSGDDEIGSVKQSLNAKILTMQNYFRRKRMMYAFTPIGVPAIFYGLGNLNRFSNTTERWIISFVISLIVFEILVIIATEIHFKILYKPALNELKNLLRQLNSDEN